jgi:hypothetical protein
VPGAFSKVWLFAVALSEAARLAREDTGRSFPGKLDFATFFLGDGIVAGHADARSTSAPSLALVWPTWS